MWASSVGVELFASIARIMSSASSLVSSWSQRSSGGLRRSRVVLRWSRTNFGGPKLISDVAVLGNVNVVKQFSKVGDGSPMCCHALSGSFNFVGRFGI